MSDIKAPVFPESIADGTVATWHKKVGEACTRDEVLADIETDKVVLEVVAPADGVLTDLLKQEGDTVLSGEVLAHFQEGAAGTATPEAPQASSAQEGANQSASQATTQPMALNQQSSNIQAGPAAIVPRGDVVNLDGQGPAVRKAAAETGINPANVQGTGPDGRVTKQDMQAAQANPAQSNTITSKSVPTTTETGAPTALSIATGDRIEKRVPMTRLRQKVAERLLAASQGTAMLTTFNEVNMKPIMDMRKAYQERFEKRHGIKLGFMSFFVKACTEALKRYPAVNASIDGTDIIYHGFYDIGVAVSSDRGLVVPVLRDTDRMNLAETEKNIMEYGKKARDGKLALDDLTGGTFTISNGGVFGSLMSTPILNPPQTAILGMHKIQERPMAVNGQVVILPMMYLALSYDHRMIDGKEAVGFLVTIKELIEDPALMLLDL